MRAIALVLALSFLPIPRVFAADTMYANDPNRELKEDIEEAYGIYILNPSRRHPKEKVEINGDNVELWLYYDPRNPDHDKIKCDAIKFLLFGRFGTNEGERGGAKHFFSRFPKFRAVEVDLFQLNSTRTVDAAGKYTVTKTPRTTLKVKISRAKSDKIDYENARKTLNKPGLEPEACVRTAERLIDAKYYSKEYFK